MDAMAAQAMAPSFFYYSPDPNPENRQHGHFTSHPGAQQFHFQQQQQQHHQMSLLPVAPTLPSTPIYSRPGSSGLPPNMHPKQFAAILPSNLTPMASPQPLAHSRPTIMLETELKREHDAHYPTTPALSSSGSVISSPGSCDMLQTPLNPMFSGLESFEGKPTVVESRMESFPNLDWTSCASPPLTPGT